MMSGLVSFLIVYFSALVLSSIIAGYVQRYRDTPGMDWFTAAVLLHMIWLIFYGVELAIDGLSIKIFTDSLQWVTSMSSGIIYLMFSLGYIGKSPKHPMRWWFILMSPMFVFFVYLFSPAGIDAIYGDAELVTTNLFTMMTYEFGNVVYIILIYAYLLALISVVLLGWHITRTRGEAQRQAVFVFLGFLIPFVGSMSFLVDFAPWGLTDTSPLYFGMSDTIIAFGILRFRLFNLVPIARDNVIENMADGVIVLDTYANIVDMNPAAAALFEGDSKTLIGQSADVVFNQWQSLKAVFHPDTSEHAHLKYPTKDGKTKHYDVVFAPIHSRTGRIMGTFITLRDITIETVSEREIQQRIEEIEQTNIELDRARREAEQANTIKSQFLASMSHELRTPLNAILNFTKFVSMGYMGEVNEKQKDALQKSIDSANHLLALINDVLDITKIESDMMTLFLENDVNVVIELYSALSVTETLIGDKPVAIINDIPDDLPTLVGDKRRLRQVFFNLISNAAKFTEQGSITVRARVVDEDSLCFSVIDTGPGIAPENHQLVFYPFEQTETGIRHANGTGLGLPISKRLVEMHGGKIELESDLDKGASFHVTLPIRSAKLIAQMEAAKAQQSAS